MILSSLLIEATVIVAGFDVRWGVWCIGRHFGKRSKLELKTKLAWELAGTCTLFRNTSFSEPSEQVLKSSPRNTRSRSHGLAGPSRPARWARSWKTRIGIGPWPRARTHHR